jgi:hypothetical protein
MKEALKKLKETKAAAENEFIPNPKTRTGHEMARRQARESLPTVKAEFNAAFRKVGFPVFVEGRGTTAFIKMASQEAEIVVVDKILSDLRKAVKASIGPSREFAVSAYTALIRELRQVGATLGLTTVASPDFRGVVYVANDAATDAEIDNYLLTSVGPEFLASIIESEAANLAETLTGDQPVVPVIITGMNTKTVSSLGSKVFNRPSLHIDVPKPEHATLEFVTEQFQQINALKSQPQNEANTVVPTTKNKKK